MNLMVVVLTWMKPKLALLVHELVPLIVEALLPIHKVLNSALRSSVGAPILFVKKKDRSL